MINKAYQFKNQLISIGFLFILKFIYKKRVNIIFKKLKSFILRLLIDHK